MIDKESEVRYPFLSLGIRSEEMKEETINTHKNETERKTIISWRTRPFLLRNTFVTMISKIREQSINMIRKPYKRTGTHLDDVAFTSPSAQRDDLRH